jgi:hypothetical protein
VSDSLVHYHSSQSFTDGIASQAIAKNTDLMMLSVVAGDYKIITGKNTQ